MVATRAWVVPVGLSIVALGLRWMLLDAPLYGDEAIHFYTAKHLARPPGNLFPPSQANKILFWQRPFFAMQLWPAAQFGFTSFRVLHSLLAAACVPLAWYVVRRTGAPVWAQTIAPLLLAVHPVVVPWGTLVFADAVLASWLLAALAAWVSSRRAAAAGLAVLAAWTKEVGYLALAAGLVVVAWEGIRARRLSLYPLHLDRPVTLWGAASLAAVAPMAYALYGLHGRPTGWSVTPLDMPTWLIMVGTLPVAALLVAGLLSQRTRAWAAAGLAYPTAFAFYAMVLGRGIDVWYVVAPFTIAVTAAAIVAPRLVHAWRDHTPPTGAHGTVWPAAALAMLVVSPVGMAALPGDSALRAAWTVQPVGESLAEQQGRLDRPDLLFQALDAIRRDDVVLLADPAWFHVFYPFSDRQPAVGYAWTDTARRPAEWTAAMSNSTVTVVHKIDRGLNVAIREVFADCMRLQNEAYAVIDNQACLGRTEALQQRADELGWQP